MKSKSRDDELIMARMRGIIYPSRMQGFSQKVSLGGALVLQAIVSPACFCVSKSGK